MEIGPSLSRGSFCVDEDWDLVCDSPLRAFERVLVLEGKEEASRLFLVFDERGMIREACTVRGCSSGDLFAVFVERRTGRSVDAGVVYEALVDSVLEEGEALARRMEEAGVVSAETAREYAGYVILDFMREYMADRRVRRAIREVKGIGEVKRNILSTLMKVDPIALIEAGYHVKASLESFSFSPAVLEEEVVFFDTKALGAIRLMSVVFEEGNRVSGRVLSFNYLKTGGKPYVFFNYGEPQELGSFSVTRRGVEIRTKWRSSYTLEGVYLAEGEVSFGTLLYNLLGMEAYVALRRYIDEEKSDIFIMKVPARIYSLFVRVHGTKEPVLFTREWAIDFDSFVKRAREKGLWVLPLGVPFRWEGDALYVRDRRVGTARVETINGRRYILIDVEFLPFLFVYGERDGYVWAGVWRQENENVYRYAVPFSLLSEVAGNLNVTLKEGE